LTMISAEAGATPRLVSAPMVSRDRTPTRPGSCRAFVCTSASHRGQ
jgi:hypothetical protein